MTKEKAKNILWHCHNSPCGGHYGGDKTAAKILQSGFFWPTLFKDAHQHVLYCDQVEAGRHWPRKNPDRQARRWERQCGTFSRHHGHHND